MGRDDGRGGVFRSPAGFPNGNTLDSYGRLLSAEQGNRRVTRTEHDGSVTVLADTYDGKKLNSPNDVIARSDGTVYFSDPVYGILSDYEGNRGTSEIGASNVYRIDPRSGEVSLAADGFDNPNGLILTPDERQLYVSDSGANLIRVFSVAQDGTLSDGRVFATGPAEGGFDNIRQDGDGRIWVAASADGVHCYDPDGTLLGRIRVPEVVGNITFGGARRNRLFLAATTSIYSLVMSVTGTRLPLPPRTGAAA
nr:SMP-30/gluconolactonase/LRE family protein [Motilibacter rhizosphaerae]